MCILLSVKLIWCSGIPYIYGQLEGVHLPLVYVHSAICEIYLVEQVFHTSNGQLEGDTYALIYVHSAICETYLV